MSSALPERLISLPVDGQAHAYAFEVWQEVDGARSLVMQAPGSPGAGPVVPLVVVLEEDLAAFRRVFEQAMEFALHGPKAYDLAEIRREHPNAYRSWSPEDDERLRRQWA